MTAAVTAFVGVLPEVEARTWPAGQVASLVAA